LDSDERLKFTLAAYNGGQTRIARAQNFAKQDGKSEAKWEDVQNYLAAAGASQAQIKEVLEYVEKVLAYEKEFSEKSEANKKLKDKDPKKVSNDSGDGHWVTLDNGNHVFIESKKSPRRSKK
jgi:membrane-bound lytic murein transglycosylase MltF